MDRHKILRSAVVGVLSVAVASGACQREPEPESTPVPELRSEALHHTDRPMTVRGCLKAGEAANTFVLTAARAEGGAETATYQLVTLSNLELQHEMRDQVGQLVQVSGTLRAQQAEMAQTPAVPAETGNDRTAGTTGEPRVQTRTDLEINQLTVDSITPIGEECGIGM